MLTPRAQQYLATLERLAVVPVSRLQKQLALEGVECFEPWLEMHDRFAGYVEPLAADWAVWGLIHSENIYFGAHEIFVENYAEPGEADDFTIACAYTHPSNDFMLSSSGVLAHRAESFERYVEKIAVIEEFIDAGPVSRVRAGDERGDEELQHRLNVAKRRQNVVEEATDDFSTLYVSRDICVRVNAKRADDAWVRR